MMNNVAINQAETIFEPFYDSGDSDHSFRKYNRLSPYTVTTGKGAQAVVSNTWEAAAVEIQKHGTEDFDVKLTRSMDLSITGFDRMSLLACIPEHTRIRVEYTADGLTRRAMDVIGSGHTHKYYGAIEGTTITSLSLIFSGPEDHGATRLFWLGLANSRMLDQREPKSVFSPEWEGCFVEHLEALTPEPTCGLFFDKAGLERLREKVKTRAFAGRYAKLKEHAASFMHLEPEADIRIYYPKYAVWGDNYGDDGECPYSLNGAMFTLGFVGIMENDIPMLKMAARMALSAACTRFWTDSAMGSLPGTTWHHRSFTEYSVCYACAQVLDFAGDLLTWHGKQLILDAIIMKGLPRLYADFRTMDYIYSCNQGFMFHTGLVAALIVLAKYYPRYQKDVEEAEDILNEMLERTVEIDGGTIEGPGYWETIIITAYPSLCMLANYRGIALKDYVPDLFRLVLDFGLALLSDFGKEPHYVPISDSASGCYESATVYSYAAAICAGITNDARWKDIFNRISPKGASLDLETLLAEEEKPEVLPPVSYDGFLTYNYTGITTLRRTSEDGIGVRLTVCGGKTSRTHSHCDKGHFILEADGIPLIADPGNGDYDSTRNPQLGRSEFHNLLVPLGTDGILPQQPKNVHGGRIQTAEYENGVLRYTVDLKDAWENGLFVKNLRSIVSADARVYDIKDDIAYAEPKRSCFLLNSYSEIADRGTYYSIMEGDVEARIYPVNYTPERVEITDCGTGGRFENRPDGTCHLTVHRLRIDLPECLHGVFLHRIEIVSHKNP